METYTNHSELDSLKVQYQEKRTKKKMKKYEIKISMIVSCAMCGNAQTKEDKTTNGSLLFLFEVICACDARENNNFNQFDARVISHEIQY